MVSYNDAYFKTNGTEEVGGLYVLKLKNHQEEFFKIGISKASSTDELYVKRLSFIEEKGYQVSLKNYYCSTLFESYRAEQAIINLLEKFAYNPKIGFTGYTECFIQDPIQLFRVCSKEILEAAEEKIIFWLDKLVENLSSLIDSRTLVKTCSVEFEMSQSVLKDVESVNAFFKVRLSEENPLSLVVITSFFETKVQEYVRRSDSIFKSKLRERKNKIKELKNVVSENEMAIKNGGYKIEMGGYSKSFKIDTEQKLKRESDNRLFKEHLEVLKERLHIGKTCFLEMKQKILAHLQ